MADAWDKAMADMQRELDILRNSCATLMVSLQNARLENRQLKRQLRDCEHVRKKGGTG